MKREQYLRRRLHTLSALTEAVAAMRALSAHHFRLSRQSLPNTRVYRDEIEAALAATGLSQQIDIAAPLGVLLVVSDLGLCGDYNSRLVQATVGEFQLLGTGPLYSIGHRPQAQLTRFGLTPRRHYPAPTSVDGLPTLLLQVAEDVLDDLVHREIRGLNVISARFEGAGRFSPVITPVLPIHQSRTDKPVRMTPYQSRNRLEAVTVREYLYTILFELLLDALASEHGMRLVATESARQWLEETTETVRRRLASNRREIATQEVLDIVAGSRVRRARAT